jgi:SAM-dependent methyltransferase
MNIMQTERRVIKQYDEPYSKGYRESDDLEVTTENHQCYCHMLAEISSAYQGKISVLDVGCGTGRYFHCLQNVHILTGMDLSAQMLKRAGSPVLRQSIVADKIHLICGNVLQGGFHRCTFDLIYSIGVLGEHSEFDEHMCNKLFELLKPKGTLLFTVVDIASKWGAMSLKRRALESVLKVGPSMLRRRFRQRIGSFYMTDPELRVIFGKSRFTQFDIVRHVSTSERWDGAHYICTATKD